jgi:hypothetical protein
LKQEQTVSIMLQIGDNLISSDVLEKKFCCDLEKCKGACCVQGDAGAPLTPEEVKILKKIYPKVKPFLREVSIEAIDSQGTHVIDDEKETVTPLVDNKECAYAVFENGIAKCGIEKAYTEGKIKFRKPISCHLYPIRLRRYKSFTAVNYDIWSICEPARILGNRENIPLHSFLKDAVIRKFGRNWFKQLKLAAEKVQTDKGEK